MFARMIARQLSLPAGIGGHIARRVMNSMNQEMNRATVEHMHIEPQHTCLDIGFGGGVTLDLMVDLTNRGRVCGIEISNTMLRHARRRFSRLINERRLNLARGTIEAVPYEGEQFDSVCTVNTVYFWQDPNKAIQETHRVLKPGGRFVLSFRPARAMRELQFTRHGFTLYDSGILQDLLRRAGFTQTKVHEGNDGHLDFVCLLAIKG